jgi:hypothetical protein
MNREAASFMICVGISVGVAGLTHLLHRKYLTACVISAVISSLLFHVFMYFQLGYFDGWFLISFFTVGAIVFGIAMACGYLITRFRKRRR